MFKRSHDRNEKPSEQEREFFRSNEETFADLGVRYSPDQSAELARRLKEAGQEVQPFQKLEQSLRPKLAQAAAENNEELAEECHGLMAQYFDLAGEVLKTEFETTLEVHTHKDHKHFVIEICGGEDAVRERAASHTPSGP